MNKNVEQHLIALQKEYLMAEMRRLIYPLEIDKAYYSKLMEIKKENVLKITEEHLDMFPENIFNSPLLMSKMRSDFANAYSYPNFTYLTDAHKKFEASDLVFYYKIGSPVEYFSQTKGGFESGFVAKPALYKVREELSYSTLTGKPIYDICKICYYSTYLRKLEIGYFLDTENSKIILYNKDKDEVEVVWHGYVFNKYFVNGNVWVRNKQNNTLCELVDKSLVVRQDIVW